MTDVTIVPSVCPAAALIRMQEHARNDIGIDIVRFHVFHGADGVETGLDGNSLVHQRVLYVIDALLVQLWSL